MLDVAKLQVKVESKGIKGTTHDLGKLENQSKKVSKSSGVLLKAFSGIFATVAASKFTADLISVNAEFQKLNASLRTVTGSALGAEVAFDMLEDFASTTPYQLDQVVGGFIKLKARGLDPSREALESYGNTASAMGKSLDQMIEAVADASTGEFERLKEFGIKARTQGDQIQFTFNGVTTTIKKDAAAIEGYLMNLGTTNFAGAMTEQMDTIGGALSNFRDSYDKMLRGIGEAGFSEAIIKSLKELSNIVGDPEFTENLAQIGSTMAELIPVFAKSVGYAAEATNWLVESVELLADWSAAYSVGQISFWDFMFAGRDEAKRTIFELEARMGVHDEKEKTRIKKEEQQAKYVEQQKLKAAEDANKKKTASALIEAEKQQKARIKALEVDADVYKKELSAYQDYLKEISDMQQAALDQVKARADLLQTSQQQTESLVKGLQEALAGGYQTTDPLDRYFTQIDKLEAKERELAKIQDPEQRIKGLQDLQNEWAKLSEPIKSGTDLILSQEEAVERATEAIRRLGENIDTQYTEQLEIAKIAVESLAEEQKRAAEVIADYEDKIGDLQQTINGLTKEIVLSVDDRASAVIDNLMAKLTAFQSAQSGLASTSAPTAEYGATVPTMVLDSFAKGTNYVPQTGLYQLHQGESVVGASRNNGQAGAGASIGSVNINITGANRSPRELAREIKTELDRLGTRSLN